MFPERLAVWETDGRGWGLLRLSVAPPVVMNGTTRSVPTTHLHPLQRSCVETQTLSTSSYLISSVRFETLGVFGAP